MAFKQERGPQSVGRRASLDRGRCGESGQGGRRGWSHEQRGVCPQHRPWWNLISACVCMCVCLCVRVCACVDIRGQVTVFAGKPSFKFQLPVCKGPEGKGGVVSRCTAPWRWFGWVWIREMEGWRQVVRPGSSWEGWEAAGLMSPGIDSAAQYPCPSHGCLTTRSC